MAEGVESALEHGQSRYRGLGALMKTRQQMNELGYTPEVAPAVLHFLTERLGTRIFRICGERFHARIWSRLGGSGCKRALAGETVDR